MLNFEAFRTDEEPEYEITLTATDPSGSSTPIEVAIEVVDVDEDPEIASGAVNTRNYNENLDSVVAIYTATDPEDTDEADLIWSLEGNQRSSFTIGNTGQDRGQLNFKSPPDFESPAVSNNVYRATVVVTDTSGNTDKLPVAITVGNVEEDESIELAHPRPQIGISFRATLDEPDKLASTVTWSWHVHYTTTIDQCTAALSNINSTSASDWTLLSNTGSSYTPADSDNVEDHCLRVTAVYTDSHDNATETVRAVSEYSVQARDNANERPQFEENGQITTSFTREINENLDAGTSVGQSILAMDVEGPSTSTRTDILKYTMSGNDAQYFSMAYTQGGGASLTVKEGTVLDHEADSSYTVTIRAIDPNGGSGGTANANVTIKVIDLPEEPEITSGPFAVAYDENGTGVVATYVAADDDDDNASPRKTLKWLLTGTNSDDFDDSDLTGNSFQLKFKSPPDFESDPTYTVTVTVTDSDDTSNGGSGTSRDSEFVTVMVANVDEAGEVNLGTRAPKQDVEVTATLDDSDGGITNPVWEWS